MTKLNGRVALVTGAGCIENQIGIGRATALTFASRGAIVAAIDKNLESAQTTVAMIEAAGGRGFAIKADVMNSGDVKTAVETCIQKFGAVDILANCVGGGKAGGLLDISQADWEQSLGLNLTSALTCSKAVLPAMLKNKRGAIVHMGSLHGVRYPGTDMLGYAVAKAGLLQLSRCIALEFASLGIRSNIILAGAVDTPEIRRRFAAKYGVENVESVMAIRGGNIPLGSCASVWDVANAALFLVSDESAHMTATELQLDGGATAVTVPSYIAEAEAKYLK